MQVPVAPPPRLAAAGVKAKALPPSRSRRAEAEESDGSDDSGSTPSSQAMDVDLSGRDDEPAEPSEGALSVPATTDGEDTQDNTSDGYLDFNEDEEVMQEMEGDVVKEEGQGINWEWEQGYENVEDNGKWLSLLFLSALSSSFALDLKRNSPSPEPSYGSSRATGGILRGGQAKFDRAGATEHQQEFLAVKAFARVYANSAFPGLFKPTEDGFSIARCKHVSLLRDLLQNIMGRQPGLTGKSIICASLLSYS